MSYDPLTGERWDRHEAVMAWNKSMDRVRYERNGARWVLRGEPGAWVWTFFNFGPWTGQLRIREDGFHWLTLSYGGTEPIHEGVTTSLFEAFQSVEQNKEVRR